MAKWLLVGALGVACLIAGVLLITSGTSVTNGQVLGVVGVVLILVSVVVFPLATRWAVFRAKGRAVAAGAGILGRLVKVLAVLFLAAVALVLYMTL